MNRSTVLAAAMVLGLAFHAQAKLYTPVFTQSFDSAETYTANFYDGSVASDILGTSESDPGTAITGETEQKQRYGATEGEMFCFHNKTSKTATNRALYKFPSSVTGLSDYKLEFDYYLSPAVGSNARHSALVIKGSNGVIATFDKPAGGENGRVTYNCNLIYGEGSSCTNTFSTGGRGTDPSDSKWAPYWLHVTIYGNATDGLFLSVVQDNGAVVLSDIRVGNFQTVDRLFFYVNYSGNTDYAKIFALDNVVCSSGANQTFIWTGAEEDNKWSTPGNWKVGDEVQTENYPMPGDNVSGVDASVLAALDIAVKLDSTGDVTRFVNFADKSQKTWTAQGVDTRWTTLANWVYTQGGFTVYETPARGDTLTFPASLSAGTEVSFNANEGADSPDIGYALVVDGNVAFVSTDSTKQRLLYSVKSISGSGVLSLENVVVRTMTSKTLAIDCNLSANGSSGLYLRGSGAKVTFSGALSGTGTLKLDADTNSNHSFTMTGNMSGFSGTLELSKVLRDNAANCSYSFNGDDSTIDLSDATVSIDDPMTMTLGGAYTEKTLKIGALSGAGTIRNNTSDAMTLALGNDETDAESSVMLAVKDGTGAWTVAKTGSNTQVLSESTVVYNVSVSGGMLETAVGRAFGSVAVSGGALGFAADNAWGEGTPYTLFTYSTWDNPSSAAIALDQSEVSTVHSASYDFTTPGTVTLTLSEAAFVWIGGASGRWDDASNWQLVGSVGGATPGYANTVTISGATVYAPATAELTGVTLSDGAKIALMFTDDTLTYTVPQNLAVADFIITAPYTAMVSDGTFTATRAAATFTWVGGASGEWTETANWTVGGDYAAVAPGTNDEVVVGTEADITFSNAGYAKKVTLNADATFSGTSIQCPQYSGSGTLSVAGIKLTAPTTGHFTIDTPINVVAETSNTFTLETATSSSQSDWRYIYFNAAISGSGAIVLNQRSRQGLAGGHFSGDCSAFAGSISVINCKDSRDTSNFSGLNTTSSNAVYTVVGRDDAKASMFAAANTTYFIGALNGTVYQQSVNANGPAGVVLEIGGRNENCAFGGNLSVKDNGKTAIRKVGTAKLTCRASNIGDVEIAGGTYEVTKNTQSGNITFTGNGIFRSTPEASASSEIDYAKKFVGSTDFPIVFDDGDTNRTWSSAIPASNTAGFTKLGTGTLTLEQAPKYTGWTTVKAGKLIVPEGTVLDVVYGAGGALEGATINNLAFAEGAVLTVGMDSLEVPGSANVSNLTVYVADPAARGAPIVVVKATGGITGTARLAFPEGTSDKLKAKWSLKALGGTLKASSIAPFSIILR